MKKYFTIICLFITLTSFGQTDWKKLEITKFCNVDDKLIESKLTFENSVVKYQDQKRKVKTLDIETSDIKGLKGITKSRLTKWNDIATLDTTCGYLIKLDEQYIYVDKDPLNYNDNELKAYIGLIIDAFKNLER